MFSNAVLHWVPDADAVLRGVSRALRPGGRFVAEFGSHLNVAAISAQECGPCSRLGGCRSPGPGLYPTTDGMRQKVVAAGLVVRSIALRAAPERCHRPRWLAADVWRGDSVRSPGSGPRRHQERIVELLGPCPLRQVRELDGGLRSPPGGGAKGRLEVRRQEAGDRRSRQRQEAGIGMELRFAIRGLLRAPAFSVTSHCHPRRRHWRVDGHVRARSRRPPPSAADSRTRPGDSGLEVDGPAGGSAHHPFGALKESSESALRVNCWSASLASTPTVWVEKS